MHKGVGSAVHLLQNSHVPLFHALRTRASSSSSKFDYPVVEQKNKNARGRNSHEQCSK